MARSGFLCRFQHTLTLHVAPRVPSVPHMCFAEQGQKPVGATTMMPGGLMSQETEFGRMMQQAVAMKTEMMKSDRRKYEKFPPFYQNTIFHDALIETRKLPLRDRIAAAVKLKEEGNGLFQEGKHEKANSKYEEAISVFRYLEVKPGYEGWRKDGKGLRDEIFDEIDVCGLSGEEGAGPEAAATIKQHKIACYLNIAACQLKIKGPGFAVCVQACESALALDETNTKALYRRAQARLLPPSAGALEQELALQVPEASPTDSKRAHSSKRTLLTSPANTSVLHAVSVNGLCQLPPEPSPLNPQPSTLSPKKPRNPNPHDRNPQP